MRQTGTPWALAAFALIISFAALPCAFGATVLITGANSGIGLEFTKEYIARGWTVIATHRRAETPPSLAEIAAKSKNLRIERLDVTKPDDAKALATKLADVPIDHCALVRIGRQQ